MGGIVEHVEEKPDQLINWRLQQHWHELPSENKHNKRTVKTLRTWKPGRKHFHELALYKVIYWYFFLRSIFCSSVSPFYPVLISGEGTAAEKGEEIMVEEVRYNACL